MNFYLANVAWTLFALTGLCLSLYLVRESVTDLRALRKLRPPQSPSSASSVLATAILIIEANKAVIQSIFLAIGVLSFYAEPTGRPVNPSAYMLVVAALIMNINSVVLIWANAKALRYIKQVADSGTAKQATLLLVQDDVAEVQRGVINVRRAATAAYQEADRISQKLAQLTGRVEASEGREQVADDRMQASEDRADVAEGRADVAEGRMTASEKREDDRTT